MRGSTRATLRTFCTTAGVLVIMALVALILGALSGRCAARASTGLSRNLRREMYARVQKFSFSNIDKYSTGGIITRLTTDVTNVQLAFLMIIRICGALPGNAGVRLDSHRPAQCKAGPDLSGDHSRSGHRSAHHHAQRPPHLRTGIQEVRLDEQRGAGEPAGHPGGEVLCA